MFDGHDADDFPYSSSGMNGGKLTTCDAYSAAVLLYVDNDLKGQELEDFRSHLGSCANCRSHVEKEKALSQLLHSTRPLYAAPTELRKRISAAATERSSGPRYRLAVHALIGRWSRNVRVSSLRVLAPVALAIALCLALVPSVVRNVRAASYVEAAVTEHRSYLRGSLSTGFKSDSPQQVTTWLADRVPFDFRLPRVKSFPETKPTYRLTGANVVNYKGRPAALVTYETQSEKISLLAVSSESAVVAGGDEVPFGHLVFHYHTESGFRVITWSNHGLSYALVSSVSGPARASCLVCHENMTDRDAFATRP